VAKVVIKVKEAKVEGAKAKAIAEEEEIIKIYPIYQN
jgi:hypothetical protein